MIAHLEVVLPILLVALGFILKLFMDRSVTAPLCVKSIYELPVDIILLSISFSVAATISVSTSRDIGLFYAFTFLVVVLLSMVAWRRSISLFEREKFFQSVIIFLLNMGVAVYCIIKGIEILTGDKL